MLPQRGPPRWTTVCHDRTPWHGSSQSSGCIQTTGGAHLSEHGRRLLRMQQAHLGNLTGCRLQSGLVVGGCKHKARSWAPVNCLLRTDTGSDVDVRVWRGTHSLAPPAASRAYSSSGRPCCLALWLGWHSRLLRAQAGARPRAGARRCRHTIEAHYSVVTCAFRKK